MSNYNQSLIEDYKQTIERLQEECKDKTDCIVSLCEKINEKHARVKELEERLKILDEESVVVEITEQEFEEYKKLKQKLKIAEEALQYYAYDVEKNKLTSGPDLYRYLINSYLDIYTNTAKQA